VSSRELDLRILPILTSERLLPRLVCSTPNRQSGTGNPIQDLDIFDCSRLGLFIGSNRYVSLHLSAMHLSDIFREIATCSHMFSYSPMGKLINERNID
jgi:hypothetical protein